MGADLWVPGQQTKERDIVTLSKDHMVKMANFHDVATKYHFAVVCQHCDHSLTGENSGHNDVFSVSCHCREYRAYIPAWMRGELG